MRKVPWLLAVLTRGFTKAPPSIDWKAEGDDAELSSSRKAGLVEG